MTFKIMSIISIYSMVHYTTRQVKLPLRQTKLNTLSRNPVGGFLLDGGKGGQNSYYGIDDYIETTGRNPYASNNSSVMGKGLDDKIRNKLQSLNISKPTVAKPKVKNITMSF